MIGVITTSYPRTAGDFAGGFVEGHVRALRALGHDVEVIAAGAAAATAAAGSGSRGGTADEVTRIPSALFYRGGAPDQLERAPLRSLVAGTAFTARLVAAVTMRARRWDSIIAHWLAPSALAALPAAGPLCAIAHGGDLHTLQRLRLLAPALHALRLRRARLVFVSEQLRSIARAAAPGLARWLDRAIVQPMGLDLARFTALVRAPTTPPTLFVAARLVPIKGVDVALDALAHLDPSVRLVVAGDGPDRAALEARTPRATFLGAVDPARRDQLLAAASVVIVPSRTTASGRTEGLPTIALEALAAGVPVVASAVGGLCELGAAVQLVRPEDPRALARSIDQAIASPPAGSDLRAAVAHLDWQRVADRLLRSE